MVTRYQKRVSGPIIDRIDLHLQVPAIPTEKLAGSRKLAESSSIVRGRVQLARDRQRASFRDIPVTANSEMTTRRVKDYCVVSGETEQFLCTAPSRFALSARSYFRIIKVARTIADIEGEKDIAVQHIAEALQYRPSGSI